jgi:hypothetical protein
MRNCFDAMLYRTDLAARSRSNETLSIRRLSSRLCLCILLLGCLAVASAGSAQAQAVTYKYGSFFRWGNSDHTGLSAIIQAGDPAIRDDAGTHSIVQHWMGDFTTGNLRVLEIGWKRGAEIPENRIYVFRGWWENNVWSGYEPYLYWIDPGSSYKYAIIWDTDNCGTPQWGFYFNDELVQCTNKVPAPGTPGFALNISTGGEVTALSGAGGRNGMGSSNLTDVVYRTPNGWFYWDFAPGVDAVTESPVSCPPSADNHYHMHEQAVGHFLTYGC